MAKIPIYESQVGTAVPQIQRTPLAVADTGEQAIGAGVAQIGGAITDIATAKSNLDVEIATKMAKVRDAKDKADGVTEYNNLINTYNESLAGKNPNEYMEGFPEIIEQSSKILEGKSVNAQNELRNQFSLWNEANRAQTQNLATRNEIALIKQEMPDKLEAFAQNGQDAVAKEYIESLNEISGPRERELWTNMYSDIKRDNDLWSEINTAVEIGTDEAYSDAKEYIVSNQPDEQKQYSMLRTLESNFAAKSERMTAARDQIVNDQAVRLGEQASSGVPIAVDVDPRLDASKERLVQRQINKTLAIGGTESKAIYNGMMRDINLGRYFDQDDMVDAYSRGLSTDQYNQILDANESNARMTPQQRTSIQTYANHIAKKYRDMRTITEAQMTQEAKPFVRDAIDDSEMNLTSDIKGWVLNGDSGSQIYARIDESLKADTRGIVQGFFQRNPFTRLGDFEETVLTEQDDRQRYDIIIELLQSGTEGNKGNMKRLNSLLRNWYDS